MRGMRLLPLQDLLYITLTAIAFAALFLLVKGIDRLRQETSDE